MSKTANDQGTSKKSFIIYKDLHSQVDLLTIEQAGELFKAIFEYQLHYTFKSSDKLVSFAMAGIIEQFKRDDERYEKICKRNRANGLHGGRPKNPSEPKEPSGLSGNPNNPSEPDRDRDRDRESDRESESVIEENTHTPKSNIEAKELLRKQMQELVDMWMFLSKTYGLPKPKKVTDARRIKMKSRIEEGMAGSKSDIISAFGKSKLLQGKMDGWGPNFDWLMKNTDNWTKVVEGNYTDNNKKLAIKQQPQFDDRVIEPYVPPTPEEWELYEADNTTTLLERAWMKIHRAKAKAKAEAETRGES